MEVLMELSEILEQDLEEIAQKGTVESSRELEWIYKTVDILKDIETIMAMRDGGSYQRNPVVKRTERKSREGDKEKAIELLKEMMQTSNNANERDAISNFLTIWG